MFGLAGRPSDKNLSTRIYVQSSNKRLIKGTNETQIS